MSKVYRLFPMLAAVLLVATLAWAGTSTHWALGPDGQMTKGTLQNNGADTTWYWDCRFGWANCGLCESCHRPTTAARGTPFTARQHETVYFPRFQTRVSPGGKLEFGTAGEFLAAEGASIVKFNARGQKIVTFPPAAMLLRNAAGQPAFIMATSRPTIHVAR